MKHMAEFGAWLWSIGECPENASLYLRPNESVFVCDLKAVFRREDHMFNRDMRHNGCRRRNHEQAVSDSTDSCTFSYSDLGLNIGNCCD